MIAGAGNIYRNEALFLTGIHPLRPAGRVRPEEWDRLWRTLRALMRRGVIQASVRTILAREAPPHPDSGRGPAEDFYVYQQTACRRCGSLVGEFPLSARRMFACPTCQPHPVRKRTGLSRIRSKR